jgi:2-(1,2-epoxy-1,2-dihydrophenyl)acetyl-CoA isomerase
MKSTVIRSVPDLFSVETDGDLTSLRFLQQELAGIDLERMQTLWNLLDQQTEHPSKVLVLDVPTGLLSPGSIDALLAGRIGPEARDHGESDKRHQELWQAFEDLRREENSQIQLVERITALDSFVIAVVRGEIDMALLGPVLCCDYQIASDDTVLVNRGLDGGLPSAGGMMWFLVRRLGLGMASRLLWSGKNLSASEAHQLGLLSEVAPAVELDSRAQTAAHWFASKQTQRLRAMKALINATGAGLQSYLEHEQLETNRTLGSIVGSR